MRTTGTGEIEFEDRAVPVAQALEEHGYVEFHAAGAPAVGEFHCSECGYGAIVHRELPPCPMCGGRTWEQSAWSPFSRSRRDEPLQ